MTELQAIIEAAFERRESLTPDSAEPKLREVLAQTLKKLGRGELRVAEKIAGEWVVHHWLKKAIQLAFRLHEEQSTPGVRQQGSPVLTGTVICQGSYVASTATLMPSFINSGAFVADGTQIETWATVGCCAQIGNEVHLCSGVGIGGVLEPLTTSPTIIEDNCYIGARSEVADGVIVEQGSVLGMGVLLNQSTQVYDRETGSIHFGRIPAGSVVVAGSLPSQCGRYNLDAAIIVKKVDAKTRAQVGVEALLRGAG